MNIERFKQLINSESGSDYDTVFREFGESKSISDELLDYVLSMDDTMDIMDCLFERSHFTKKQLKTIAQFIKKHIKTHSDPVFRNELINFAFNWQMDDFWDDCIGFIENSNEHSILIIISLHYIYERMTIENLPQVKTVFDTVVNSTEYYQNCQTVAAFYLFRLTHDRQYYEYLKESMPLDNGGNKPVLKNLLNETYNQQEVFAFHDEMLEWTN